MKVTWARRAISDLRKITDYIQTDDPEAAARVAARVLDETASLAKLAARGRSGRVPGTRELIFHA